MTDYDTLKELTVSQVLTEPYLSDFRSPAPDWGYLLSKGLNTVEVSKHRLVYLALQAINIESAQTPDHFKHFAILYAARQREFLNSWVLEQGNDAGVQASRSFFQWKREDHESMASSTRLMDNEQLDTWMREEIEELENSYDEENDEYFYDETGIDIAVEHYDHQKDQNNIVWGQMFYHSDADSLFLNPNWNPDWGSNDDTSEDTVLQNIFLYGSFPSDFEDGHYIETIYEYLNDNQTKLELCYEKELLCTDKIQYPLIPYSYGLGHHRNGADPKSLSEDLFGIIVENGGIFDLMKEISESTGLPYKMWCSCKISGAAPLIRDLASNIILWAFQNYDKDANLRCLYKDFEASVIMGYEAADRRMKYEVGYYGIPTPIEKLGSFLPAALSKTAEQIIGRASKYVDLISAQEIENLILSIKKREWEIGLFSYPFEPLVRELRDYYDNDNTEVPSYELDGIQAVLLRHKDVEKNISELLEIMLIHKLKESDAFNDTDLRYIDGRFKSEIVHSGVWFIQSEMPNKIARVIEQQYTQSMQQRNTYHPAAHRPDSPRSIISEDKYFTFLPQFGAAYSKIEGVPLPDKPKQFNPPKMTTGRMGLHLFNIEVRIMKADESGAVSKILTSEISNFLKNCKDKIYPYIGAISQISDKRIGTEDMSSELPTIPSLVFDIPAQEAVTGLVLLKAMGGEDVDPEDEEFIEDCCRYAPYFRCSPEEIRETCSSADIRKLLDFDTAMKDDIYRYSIAHPDTLPARREVPQPSLCKGFGI